LARALQVKAALVAAGGKPATAFLCAAHTQALSGEHA
jgi:hypothetical protein